ncbi:MAG: HAMP domain-containing histidine kinase [Acidobacteriota bacterium]|nr:HAMP domain-containing histidine kinase [Acidobacteriota bacterium]MDE3044290.1 HAMP domain-containing histidine kinase [Acidobacteriota bacterium]
MMRQRSLRVRLLTTFGLGAFILSSLFASLTYVGVHHVLVSDKIQSDLKQSYVNAALIRSTLYTAPPHLASLLNSIESATQSNVLVQTHHQWLSRSHFASTNDVPASLIDLVRAGHPAYQTLVVHGQIVFVVGVPIPAVETQFYEVFHLGVLDRTLRTLLQLLAFGALVTAAVGYAGGNWVARRAVRPLESVSRAAAAIAQGELTTRLAVVQADREVQQLTQSFNEMVAQLVSRLERDARFASDVSHELRSPLTTLATAAAVLQSHHDELSASGQESLDLLMADLSIFQSLVEDLLEMARSDAGAVPLVIETVSAVELVRQCLRSAARRHGLAEPAIELGDDVTDPLVSVDRRRFERVVTNLLDNAHRYAGGTTAVRVHCADGQLVIDFDDAGPGVPDDERDAIFERFFRGRAAHDRSIARGTGLGLALVRDHVRAIGGQISVWASPDGGARFEILLPLVEEAS